MQQLTCRASWTMTGRQADTSFHMTAVERLCKWCTLAIAVTVNACSCVDYSRAKIPLGWCVLACSTL